MSDPRMEFLSELGSGAFGVVYLIRDKTDEQLYALKTVDLDRCSDDQKALTMREAEIMKQLDHEHLLQIYGSFLEGKYLNIIMEYCEGGDLGKFLQDSEDSLPEELIVCWIWQIASALSHMHSKNILHRDLKPQNIFLTKTADVKVGDLGIARVLENSADVASTVVGTPCYMSPEILNMAEYNSKTDIWSFGCVVYEIATKKLAYSAFVMPFLLAKVMSGKTPSIPDDYSSQLNQLEQSMLSKNPDERPSADTVMSTSPVREYGYNKKPPLDILQSTCFCTRWGTDKSKISVLVAESTRQLSTVFDVSKITIPVDSLILIRERLHKKPEVVPPELQSIVAKPEKTKEKSINKEPKFIKTRARNENTQILHSLISTLTETKTDKPTASSVEDQLLEQIRILQEYCARGIGEENLRIVYRIMSNARNPEEYKEDLKSFLGSEKFEKYGEKLTFLNIFEIVSLGM